MYINPYETNEIQTTTNNSLLHKLGLFSPPRSSSNLLRDSIDSSKNNNSDTNNHSKINLNNDNDRNEKQYNLNNKGSNSEEITNIKTTKLVQTAPITKKITTSQPTTPTTIRTSISNESPRTMVNKQNSFVRGSREFWMPDNEVNLCYDCQTAFSTFKRRHHCRICGQIFCWRCTQNTIKLTEDNSIRVCNACYRAHSKSVESPPTPSKTGSSNFRSQSYEELNKSQKSLYSSQEKFLSKNYRPVQDMQLSADLLNNKSKTIEINKSTINNNSYNNNLIITESPNDNKMEVNNNNNNTIINNNSNNNNNGNGSVQFEQPCETNSNIEYEKTNNKHNNNNINNDNKDIITDEGIQIEGNNGQMTQADALYLKIDAEFKKFKQEEEPVTFTTKVYPRKLRKAITFNEFPMLTTINKQDKITMDKNYVGMDINTQSKKMYSKMTEGKISKLIKQLIKEEEVEENWFDIIKKFTNEACSKIRPRIKKGDLMDIREYVKVKIIPDGNINDSAYINGVVFNKNIAHKRLKSDIKNAKVLLLSGALEFQKENRFLQIDDVLSQERSHLKFLVARIAALKPDLVLIGKSVSRLAQEFLCEENITFALNVKSRVLRRIARAIETDILASPTDNLLDPNLGQVESFYVKTYKETWGSKSMMFFDGCPNHLSASILLRGASIAVLKKVKRITLFAIYAAYNLFLESHLLMDECASLSDNTSLHSTESISTSNNNTISNNSNTNNILSCSFDVNFPYGTSLALDSLPSMYDEENDKYVNLFTIMANYQFYDPNLLPLSDEKYGDKDYLIPTVNNYNNSISISSTDSIDNSKNDNNGFKNITIQPTFYDHQKILYLHSLCCNTTQQQCIPFEFNLIEYYQLSDLTLGLFLEQYCFDTTYRCKYQGCNRSMLEHERCFMHGNGRLNITISEATIPVESLLLSKSNILIWSSCKICGKATPYLPLSDQSWNYSFGKYLELSFYSFDPVCSIPSCHHSIHFDHLRYFYFNNLIVEFEYETVTVLEVTVPSNIIVYNPSLIEKSKELDLELLASTSQQLYDNFAKRFTQIEFELTKGTKDQQIQQYILSCKNEKNIFLEEIELFKHNNVSNSISTLKRKLYANAITWNSTLHEQLLKIQKRKVTTNTNTHTHTRTASWKGSADDFIKNTDPLPLIKENSSNYNSAPFDDNLLYAASTLNNNSNNNNNNNNLTLINNKENIDSSTINEDTITLPVTTNAYSSSPITGGIINTAPTTINNNNNNNIINNINTTNSGINVGGSSIGGKVQGIPGIINAFTNLMVNVTSIQQPLLFPPGFNDTVVVIYEDEPSSIIAYTLTSNEYREKLDNKEKLDKYSTTPSLEALEGYWKTNLMSKTRSDIVNKFEYDKYGYKVQITSTCYYAKQFHALRVICAGEEQFILSLARCKMWDASGGKSGSSFSKTADNRYIIKEVSKVELDGFLQVAPLYFEYLSNALFHQVPTILGKIFGVYTIKITKAGSGKTTTQNLVVMENLFYNKNINKIYDLKGSRRNRYVDPDSPGVLLDQNLLQVMFTTPICVDQLSKIKLQASIWNDTLFLSSLGVMDYSLVIGIDVNTNQLVAGIIDYLRLYTWDKQFETWVKSTGIIGGRGIPTVISPSQYKIRFREAMNFYFVLMPIKQTNFVLQLPDYNDHLTTSE